MIYSFAAIRKLTASRDNVENKLERRDFTKDYVNPDSQTYAPLTRVGVFLDRNSESYNVKSRYLSTYDGLLELENFLPDFVVQPRIKAPKPKTVTKAGFIKRKYRQENELAEIHEVNPTLCFIKLGVVFSLKYFCLKSTFIARAQVVKQYIGESSCYLLCLLC